MNPPERLDVTIPEYRPSVQLKPESKRSHPFSRARHDLYSVDELKDIGEGKTARTDFYEKVLVGLYWKIGRAVPYVFETMEGEWRSSDAGCVKFLLDRNPKEIIPHFDSEKRIVAIEPTDVLLHRYDALKTELVRRVSAGSPEPQTPSETNENIATSPATRVGNAVVTHDDSLQDQSTATIGPPPSVAGYFVSRELRPASVYALRFGDSDVFKIGWAFDVDERVSDIRNHVPEELLAMNWDCVGRHLFADQNAAYYGEQLALTHFRRLARGVRGERVRFDPDDFYREWERFWPQIPSGSPEGAYPPK